MGMADMNKPRYKRTTKCKISFSFSPLETLTFFEEFSLSLVPFAGLYAGLKHAGLSPAKCPAESPAKKIAPQKSKLGL